jgi:hypothetical protein
MLLLAFPNAPFAAYWAGSELLNAITTFPKLDPTFGETAAGQATGDDFRFVRTAWEVELARPKHWKIFAKGGDYSRYYCNWHLLVDWSEAAIEKYKKLTIRSVLISRRRDDFLGKPALIWSRVNEKGFNVRVLPAGACFADKAPALFAGNNAQWLLGYLSSALIDQVCSLQNPNRMFELRDVSKLPIADRIDRKQLGALADSIFQLKLKWNSSCEPSTTFTLPLIHIVKSLGSLTSRWTDLRKDLRVAQENAQAWHEEINILVSQAFGLERKIAERLEHLAGAQANDPFIANGVSPNEDGAINDVLTGLISYSLGSSLGLWDIRYATGERQTPELPDPFAPLPVCPPGMLQNTAGLPAGPEDVPSDYPVKNIPWDGILVDDPAHPLDIERRIREVIEIIWTGQNGAPNAAAIEAEACELLEVRSLREYFRKPAGFFADHLKRYSKSRRKAPIYWPLSTPSGGYTIWLYYHRLNDGTLYKVVEQFVEPKQAEVQATFQTLAAKESRSRAEDRELENAQTLLGELAAFRDDLLRLAKIWKPNLNDGVVITASPLWRHFRFPAWQKELRTTWESLERGEYDWAHLAYTLWPERVTEKCKTDRSLAIAHNLEHLCTIEPPKPKKKRSKAKVEEDAPDQDEML